MNVEKFSVSIPKDLYDRLEKFMSENQISDRSKIIQIALRDFLDENEKDNRMVLGIINVVYDEKQSEEVLKFQHEYEDFILSVLHVHRGKICVEAIAVKGIKSDLLNLTNKLSSLKGVKKAKLIISTSEE
ncbi:MAG: CopG family ribbon-helix-helix protein [Sulfolobaceae archaeon]|jgi:CopG family nickel-responsive transcriptional regulator|nr:CopG family ribbon-helix-helix protein [Sulfolobaceae archaeon]